MGSETWVLRIGPFINCTRRATIVHIFNSEGARLIQTTAPISHGSSGGGLFDTQGKLIGVTTFAVKDGQNLNFALPAEWVLSLREHPATEFHQTDAEKNASQALLLSQVAGNALNAEDYEKALEAYQQLSQLTPDDPSVWAVLGELYLQLKALANAQEACQRAIRLSSEQADGWACLGDVYEQSGQYSPAEEALKKAIDLDPNEPVNWLALGRVFAEEGKRLGVMTVYDRLKTLDHNYADQFFRKFVQPILESPNQ